LKAFLSWEETERNRIKSDETDYKCNVKTQETIIPKTISGTKYDLKCISWDTYSILYRSLGIISGKQEQEED
jgi:hypothetical protein